MQHRLPRRRFLATMAGAAAALSVSPRLLAQAASAPGAPALPPRALLASDPASYWAALRKLFLIPAENIYLNNGTVGSSPLPVLNAVFDMYRQCEALSDDDPEDYPIWGYGAWNQYRDPLARFLGCSRDELALVRNATEANSYIANGLDLAPGDEVVLSDQEHPSGEQPWRLRARRYGIVVRKFELPQPADDDEEILRRLTAALSPRTRVIFISHINTVTGLVMPVQRIAALARERGILCAVDGAHVPGMMRLNVRELGCDLYSASPHKWLQAPKGTGFLYVRDEVIDRMWSTVTTHGWDQPELRAQRFQQIGTSNVPALAGLKAALEMAEDIGLERIEQRQRMLCSRLHEEMERRGARPLTSRNPAMRCAITSFDIAPLEVRKLQLWMWQQHRIRLRGTGPARLRLSTPYYLLERDMERFLAAYDQYRRTAS
jgi:isopenicillin-N epimerase